MPKRLIYSPINDEIWKPIPGFDNRYEASSEGRLRVVKGKFVKSEIGYLLATFSGDYGYSRTAIMRNGKVYKPCVQVLVALAFLGECPDGYEVDHVDRDKKNNRASNLEYVTHRENIQRARRNKSWSNKRLPNATVS